MRRRIAGLLVSSTVVVAVLFVLPTQGADAQLDVDGDIYYLRTNTTGGICKTTVRRAVVEVRCQDGQTVVAATSDVPCFAKWSLIGDLLCKGVVNINTILSCFNA